MRSRTSGGIAETAKTLVYAIVIALFIRTFFYEPFNIPSASMVPTLLIGDYLFVSKFSYGYSRYSLPFGLPLIPGRIFFTPPKRGDVVVFKLPTNPSIDYIKRVIGLPGDHIQMKNGILNINDVPVTREPSEDCDVPPEESRGVVYQRYWETLPGGVRHCILEMTDSGSLDNTGVFVVPPDHYFMMGDNRDNSSDSRLSGDQGGVGYVPFENLIGRAEVIFFSIEEGTPAWELWRWPWTVRWDRIFQRVR